MDGLFAGLIAAQFLIVATHDWIDVPGLAHGRQVQAVIGRRKLAWATLINALFPGVALVYAVRFLHAPKPGYVTRYWLIYTAITAGSAFFMWWVPYFFGGSAERRGEYEKLYRGTRFILPERHGERGPNLLHLFFHALFLATFALALVQVL